VNDKDLAAANSRSASREFVMRVCFASMMAISFLAFLEHASAIGAEPRNIDSEKANKLAAEAKALAAKIDKQIAAQWDAKGARPAARTDDAEFLRRVCLDLRGRIPSLTELRDFLDDPAENKRTQMIGASLGSDESVDHFANFWRRSLLSGVENQQAANSAPGLESWLATRLKAKASYDQIVRDILSASPTVGTGPGLFYQAFELKPENAAAATSRLFLGVKLECAQCHNHPFANWKRQQFWEFAAFFTTLPAQPGGQAAGNGRDIKIPDTDSTVSARFLSGGEPQWSDDLDSRATLAAWLTSADNPYFSAAAVNRLWEYFFGVGLVDPVDGFNADNPASHPELLTELARQFAAHHFDLEYLIRAITSSRTYQLTSTLSDESQNDPRLFARMNLRGMTAEQLFDSLAEATGRGPHNPLNPGLVRGAHNLMRTQFVARFPGSASHTQTQISILQALYFMNGKLTADATALDRNKTLQCIAEANTTTEQRIQELYALVLSRKARGAELERLVKYVDGAGTDDERRKAIEDIFWVLINSGEFCSIH
jgi:hypothetical protein